MGPFHCRREDPPAALPAALTGDASGSCVADCVAAGVRKCGTALDRPSHKWMDAFDTWDHCSYFGPVICGRKSSRSLLKENRTVTKLRPSAARAGVSDSTY